MSDSPISTESTGTTESPEPTPISAAPAHKSPLDQAKDAATKVLSLITGRK